MSQTVQLISPKEVRAFSKLAPWRTVVAVASDWLLVVFGVVVFVVIDSWWLYPLIVIWVGARQHALAVLMHESIHYRTSHNRGFNDWFGSLFCAWPLFVSLDAFRRSHLAHHRHANTADDPDWNAKASSSWLFPKPRLELIRLFLFDLLGLHAFDFVKILARYATGSSGKKHHRTVRNHDVPPRHSQALACGRILLYVAVITTISLTNTWIYFLLLWVVPTITWLKFSLRLRSISEHFGVAYDHPLRETRTTRASFVEHFFLAPRNINFHIEHHEYPSVPFYRLPALHRRLLEVEEYRNEAHVSTSYWQVINECCHSDAPKRIPTGAGNQNESAGSYSQICTR